MSCSIPAFIPPSTASWQTALQVLQSQVEEARSRAAASEQDGQVLTELSAQLRTWETRCAPISL